MTLRRLTDPSSLLASFEDPRDVVLQRLNTAGSRASPNVPFESVANASSVIQRSEAPFPAIVVISATPVERTMSPGNDLLGRIVDSHATVHVLTHRDPARPPSPEVLREVTEQTRGQFITVYSTAPHIKSPSTASRTRWRQRC